MLRQAQIASKRHWNTQNADETKTSASAPNKHEILVLAPAVYQDWSKAYDWPVKNVIVASLPIKLKENLTH